MNTDDNQEPQVPIEVESEQDWNNNVNQIVEVMSNVNTESPAAELNATSMQDFDGERIEFNEDLPGLNTIK